ncbi:MAG: hypothetical protein JJ896_04825 [Rhodothermales bacterium]|nr:hypothetical protein [Rhodothermales bacterium]MBO6778957.1 hypothetical protein [Rhodothermales bacterium]
MGRIIDTGMTPAKKRRAHQRSCAEVLRLLAERPIFDAEGRDMVAFLAFNLRGIYATIDESAGSWDEKNYWKKAEGLREKWRWSRTSADELERLIRGDAWNEIPQFLIGLVPHFSSVRVTAMTRDSDWWVGAYRALVREG